MGCLIWLTTNRSNTDPKELTVAERNDPCPCGSGRKYKKCCLEKDAKELSSQYDTLPSHIQGRDIAGIIHLFQRFASVPFQLAQDRLVVPDCLAAFMALEHSDPDLFVYVSSILAEAAIAQMAREEWGRKFASRLTVAQTRYLQEMATNSLRPWTVLEVFSGEGLVLQDAETGERIRVLERSGSVGLVPHEQVAARVLHDHTQPTLSHMFRLPEGMLDRIRQGKSRVIDPVCSPEEALEIALVREFVRACAIPAAPGRVVDAASGGLLELVRDRFTVQNKTALKRWLDTSLELDIDPREPDTFIRFEELAGGARRALGHLELQFSRGKLVLELHSRSRDAANANRTWLKEQTGAWLRFTSRKVEDIDPAHKDLSVEEIALPVDPAEVMSPEFMEQLYRTHFYRDWKNTPIPSLQNQTPRQHACTERGEAAVIELVRSYQAQENRMARDQGRTPVNLNWLLEDVGIQAEP